MEIKVATIEHLEEIISLLANDKLGSQRENYKLPLPDHYVSAYHQINLDPNQFLMVGTIKGEVVATMQLSLIQYLTYQGGIRAQIEAVRVREDQRGKGLGEQLFNWAIEKARTKGAHLVQLTTDKKRPDALKFYESLGFVATHEGMKLHF